MKRLLQSVLVLAIVQSPLGARAQNALMSSVAAAYGSGVSAGEVELSAGASLPCDAKQIRITGVRRINADVAQVTVRCEKTTVLPVVAWVRSTQLPQASPRVAIATAPKKVEPPLIRAGARVMLELVQKGMLISLPVVCLASGRTGEAIRVMDTTGRLRYRATVISADLLRAELP